MKCLSLVVCRKFSIVILGLVGTICVKREISECKRQDDDTDNRWFMAGVSYLPSEEVTKIGEGSRHFCWSESLEFFHYSFFTSGIEL